MQVRGQYRYRWSGPEIPVSEGLRSKHKREANRLAFVVDPVSSKAVEDRSAVRGWGWLEDSRDRAHRYRSFL